jgi:mannose-6-phosphate isomerase-like protein (cupin superfamily)
MPEEISLGSDTGVVHVTLDDGTEEYRFQDSHALIAIVMSQAKPSMGLSFPTSEAEEFQIGQMSWPTGHKIQAHSHKPITRTTQSTSEVLFVRRGKVRMTLFTAEGQPLGTKDLGEGDVVALFSGGHGFEILEDADIVEVKQGPYTGEDEKFRFPDTDEA